ncbi:MAG: DUF4386 domain-containing protein [FCB group bacterium]|nr:DUF4386 domain-containing protein [FCB group bacterium]
MTSDIRNSGLIGGSPLVHARVAGLVGVVMLASGSFANVVASRLVVRGDIITTSNNIAASEFLYRLEIVSGLVMMVVWLYYAMLLYRLLGPVDRNRAKIMLGLVMASVPIYMLNQVNQFAVLLSASDQLHEQVGLFLNLSRFGSLIAGIFFGLWLFPLGFLVFKSGFLPRFLGALLMFGGLGYLVLFVQAFLFAQSGQTLWNNPFLVVTHISELALLLWLLIKGVNVDEWKKRTHELTTP